MLIPFPFEDGQFLLWSRPEIAAEAQIALQRCFVDAGIYVDSESILEGEWPSIGSFSTSGSTVSFSISAAGSLKQISVDASDERFPYVSGKTPWGSYVIVMSSEGMKDFCSFCSSNSISPSSPPAQGNSSTSGQEGYYLRLCAKCVTMKQHGLSSIMVYDGVSPKEDGPHFVLTGDVSVKPGNNMTILEPDEGVGVSLNAVPGAGLGTVPCGTSGQSCSLPRISSPDGHVRLFNDTCYDLEPGQTYEISVDGEPRMSRDMIIHAKCTSCCTCAMYESIVNDRLAPLFDIVKSSKESIDGLLSDYESAVKRFNQRIKRPSLSDISLSLTGMPIGKNLSPKLSNTSVRGKMARCAFTAMLKNSSYANIYATVLELSGTDSVVEASASWSDEDGSPKSKTGNSAGSIIGSSFTVYPGRSLAVTFISKKSGMVKSVSTGGYSGAISFVLSYSAQEGVSGGLGVLRRSVEV